MDTTTEEGRGAPETTEPRGPARRAIDFVKRRPLTTLAIGGGVALLGGAEWAAPALVGGALVALLSRDKGPALRRELRARADALVADARRRLHRERREAESRQGEPPAPEPPPAPPTP